MSKSHLFTPFTLRGITLKNRLVVSPMCMYSANDGFFNEWHHVHLSSRAVGGYSLIFTEAAAVCPEGRITPRCAGLWKDSHIDPLRRSVQFIKSQGAIAGVQLAHAGRKGSSSPPWEGSKHLKHNEEGWDTVAPSPIAFNTGNMWKV